jgi:hypothetical protein
MCISGKRKEGGEYIMPAKKAPAKKAAKKTAKKK